MAALNTFNADDFRLQFPEFASISEYPDAKLKSFWDSAFAVSGNRGYSRQPVATGNRILNLLTAHFIGLTGLIASGNAGGNVTSSRVGDVSVSVDAPKSNNAFQYWLNQTSYGAQLLALLSGLSVGGLYVGGRPELAAFRKVGGFR